MLSGGAKKSKNASIRLKRSRSSSVKVKRSRSSSVKVKTTEQIRYLFKRMISYGFSIRIHEKDGLAAWKEIKPKLEALDKLSL